MNVRNPVSVLQFTTDDLMSYTRRKFYYLKIRAWWYTTCLHTCMQSAAALCGAPATTCTATGESNRWQGWRKPWAIGPLGPSKFYLAHL